MTAPDPKILAAAIKKAEVDLQTFHGIDDPEIKKLVEFSEVILVAAKAYGPMREALTPSGDTKAAYRGEFKIDVPEMVENDDGEMEEHWRSIPVPWTTIKEIMAAIVARAALNPAGPA